MFSPADAVARSWLNLATDPNNSLVTIRQWRQLLGLSTTRHCTAGTTLLAQSAAARNLYVIDSGLVKLGRITANGHETAILLRFPGDLVGIYGTLLRRQHFVAATTVTDCQLLEISVDRAMQVFRSSPDATFFLAQRQSIDAVRLHLTLLEARFLTAEQRFFRLLLQLADFTMVSSSRGRVSVRVPLTEAELANLIGMNRSAFSRLKCCLIRRGKLVQHDHILSFSRRLAEESDRL